MDVRSGYKQTEVGIIPGDWSDVQLGELRPFVTSGSRGWASFYSERGDLFVRITNLSRDTIYIDISNSKFVRLPPGASECARTQLRPGDVLISITADIGIIGYIDSRIPSPAFINQHIALIRFDSSIISGKFASYFLASENPQKRFRASTDTGAKAGMNLATVQEIRIALPPIHEQHAIASALGDVDALLAGLDRLIAKKRNLKHAAMQQLLTGKTRLEGFKGEWELKRLGEIARIKTGSRNNEDKIRDGTYPFYVRSEVVERINSYSHDCEAILVPGEGRIGDIFHYVNGRFDVHQRVYAITQFTPDVSVRFVHFYMAMNFGVWAMRNTVKATVDSLRLPTFQAFELRLPRTKDEQSAIASVLSDIDTEISTLEARRDKTRALKQGMMQELLTGRIRLV